MDIPAHWREILRRAQTVTPHAYLAGGALRDLDHGVPHKDLDIFFQSSGDADRDFNALREVFPDIELKFDGSYMDRGDASIGSVYAVQVQVETCYSYFPEHFQHTHAWPVETVQFIAMPECRDIHDVLNRLDFGICRIGFDGERVVRTADYHLDCQRHEFTLMPSADTERSLRRYERLLPKYPGFTLNAPQVAA